MSPRTDELACELGRRLFGLRREAGLSQQDVADMTGVTRETIGLIERGARGMRVSTLVLVAGALQAKPSRILDGIEFIPGPPPPRPKGTWSFTPPAKRGFPARAA